MESSWRTSVMKPGERLGRLDDLDVPDLRGEIQRRAGESDVLVELVDRPRRRPSLAWTAAAGLIVIAAFGLGVLAADHRPAPGTVIAPTWAIRGRIAMPGPPSLRQPLLAPNSSGLWVAQPHGTELFHVAATGPALRIDRHLAVAPVVALAADDQHLWILTADGNLLDLTSGSTPVRVGSLGSLASTRATLAVAGGRVWIGGSPRGPIVAVDPDGSIAVVPGAPTPQTLTGSSRAAWSVGAGGTVSVIDAASATISHTLQLGAVVDAVADPSGLWLATQQGQTLEHLDGAGSRKVVATDLGRASSIRLASTGRLVWSADAQVFQAFDLLGGPRHTVVVGRASVAVPDIAATPGGIWSADALGHTVTLVAPG